MASRRSWRLVEVAAYGARNSTLGSDTPACYKRGPSASVLMEQAQQRLNAMTVAAKLAGHPNVSAVHYPGLPGHPGHAIAARQMTAFGGMLSFRVRGGRDAAIAAVGKGHLFQECMYVVLNQIPGCGFECI